MEKIYKIGRFDEFSDGSFYLVEEFTTDSPYWKVIDGVIFYIFWDAIGKKYVERKRSKMNMSREEAIKNNSGCYYAIL